MFLSGPQKHEPVLPALHMRSPPFWGEGCTIENVNMLQPSARQVTEMGHSL